MNSPKVKAEILQIQEKNARLTQTGRTTLKGRYYEEILRLNIANKNPPRNSFIRRLLSAAGDF